MADTLQEMYQETTVEEYAGEIISARRVFLVPVGDSPLYKAALDFAGVPQPSEALNDSGIFKATSLQKLTDRHLSGRRDYSQVMWALLMLEQFLTRHSQHSGNRVRAKHSNISP